METAIQLMGISSPAFGEDEVIPVKYSCEGEGINPPLEISNIPVETQTLALIVEDPDAPNGTYDHWIVWNIEPLPVIDENSNPGVSGSNSAGKTGYHPPCPPSGAHRYYFHVFALDTEIDLLAGEPKEKLLRAMETHILAKGSLMGRYEKSERL
jgi:Raf kinase inhibitor-like YbhB/YbcL family protein